MAGATLVQVGDAIRTRPEDLASALAEDVAAVVFFLQGEMLEASLSLTDTLKIAHAHHIPVIVDAAAELPPRENLWKLAQAGADLVIFSGSKDLRGPQTSGLMVGRGDLITSARIQTAPHEHVIGRPMKAGKEVVAGLVAAVESYLAEDEAARFAEWERIAAFLVDQLVKIAGLKLRRFTPTQPYIQPACIPRVGITLREATGHTISDLKTTLWEGEPPVAVEIVRGELWINVHTLTMTEAEIIVDRIKAAFIESAEN
jgi:L-seryl-tRNA(Ser) seleniumtransferase